MFAICDQNDVVQDIASEQANLSRGYSFPGYKLYPDVDIADIQIGDTFKDGVLTKNQAVRDEAIQHFQNEKKVSDRMRANTIAELITEGKLPADYT